ncbi:MAG: hypothetical protein UE295_12050 [Acutalibacteraceae bacterium]|nr:hypothetical protein [Acutalibacteraceae bacterium]
MMKIKNANKVKITGYSHLPNMSSTIVGWFLPIRIGIITRTVVDFEQVETVKWVDTQGVVQQYHTENLEISKDGDRSWDVIQIHCLPDLQLENDNLIIYKDIVYKVMNNNNYSDYGYMEYICVETFTRTE